MTLGKDSIAVVTGAASGIGRALSVALAREPVRGIVVCDVNADELAKTVRKVEETGAEVISIEIDVSRLAEIERLKDFSIKEYGTVTHLFNNAGVGLVGRTEEVSFEDMKWLFDINFWGTVYPTKLFLPVFRGQGFGHIINISSVFGFIAPPGQSTYCASKFAVRGFTESLRHELEGSDIEVTCVHPGGIRTNIARSAKKGQKAPQEDKEMAPVIFDKLARTLPEDAAKTIIRGVKAASPRVLIGSDARQISAIQRIFPKGYFRIMDRISGGMLSKFK